MTKRNMAIVAVVVALVASVGILVAQPGSTDAAQGVKGDVQIDLLIELGVGPDGSRATVGDVQLVISNIGSSGQDGVRRIGDFQVDSFFDITYSRVSNIGSSGLDGVSVANFQVDSFFDIVYRIDPLGPREPPATRTVQTEMLSMSLTGRISDPSDPGAVLGRIGEGLAPLGDMTGGHVTILK